MTRSNDLLERKSSVKKHSDSTEACVAEPPPATPQLLGAMTGTFTGLTPLGLPLIEVAGVTCSARSCVPLQIRDVGKEVVVAFDAAHPDRAIVLGLIQPPATDTVEVVVDGKSVVLNAHESLSLRCGDASITLNTDGKIVIRGAHVVSHAMGVNRIRGGSVELN